MLHLPYVSRALAQPPPPNLPSGTHIRFRPIVRVTLVGPTETRHRAHAVLDTGSDECLFPMDFLDLIGGTTRPESTHHVTWRGTRYPIQYAEISLLLTDNASTYRWSTVAAFTSAPIKFSLLGHTGCLQYFDARFLGADRTVELEANWTFPGNK